MKANIILVVCIIFILGACKKSDNSQGKLTSTQYSVRYQLVDSTYGYYSYYFDSTRQIHYSQWDSLYPQNEVLAILVDTGSHYLVYKNDTFSLSPTTAGVYEIIGNLGYDYNSIKITDSIVVTHFRSTTNNQASYDAYVHGYKVP